MTLSLTQTFRSNQNSMNGTDPRWDKENVHFIRMYQRIHENELFSVICLGISWLL